MDSLVARGYPGLQRESEDSQSGTEKPCLTKNVNILEYELLHLGEQ